jgi:hypothetical protein
VASRRSFLTSPETSQTFGIPTPRARALATMLMTEIVGSTKTAAEAGLVVFCSAEAALLCALAIRDVIRELGIEIRYRCSYG